MLLRARSPLPLIVLAARAAAAPAPPALAELASLPQAVRTCFLANANRTSCGWPGMTQQTCADRGCCWDSSQGGLPWCFYSQTTPDNKVAPGPTIRYAGAQTAPTVASVQGAAHAAIAGDAAAGLSCLSIPPLAGECDFDYSGSVLSYSWPFQLRVDAQPPALELDFTWLPFELQRSAATAAGATVATALRLSGAQPLALLVVNVSGSRSSSLSLSLPMHVATFPGTWDWGRPTASPDPNAYSVSLLPGAAGGALSADKHSAAVAASAAWAPGGGAKLLWGLRNVTMEGLPSGAAASLDVTWPAGEDLSLCLVLALGTNASDVAALAGGAASNFAAAWAAAEQDWSGLWADAFSTSPTAADRRFSGSLPVLPWPPAPDGPARLSRAYYGGVVSMLQLLRNASTSGAAANRGWQLPTAAPVWAVTTSYLWDSSMVATVMSLLEPAGFRDMIGDMLAIDTHQHYAADYLSGSGVGPWYSFNDVSVFTLLDRYGRAAGVARAVNAALASSGVGAGASDPDPDPAWYNSTLRGKRIVEWMDSAATYYLALPVDGGAGGLADYGGASNLLECVPSYIHAVPALNAANVQMLNRTAAVWAALGNATRAAELLAYASSLLPHVLATRVAGQGYFACIYPDGSRVPVRHVVDFISIADAIPWALDADTRQAMRDFVFRELVSAALANTSCTTNGTWMRALALADPAAPSSDRADHGPLGAYDGWPARTALALAELGFAADGAALLAGAAGVLDEGPFGQAHRLFLDNVPRKAGGDGGQDALESVGGAFAEAALLMIAQSQSSPAGVGGEIARGTAVLERGGLL